MLRPGTVRGPAWALAAFCAASSVAKSAAGLRWPEASWASAGKDSATVRAIGMTPESDTIFICFLLPMRMVGRLVARPAPAWRLRLRRGSGDRQRGWKIARRDAMKDGSLMRRGRGAPSAQPDGLSAPRLRWLSHPAPSDGATGTHAPP